MDLLRVIHVQNQGKVTKTALSIIQDIAIIAILSTKNSMGGVNVEKTIKDQKERIYEILISQFKDARNRTEYLDDKSYNLLGFGGVINTILLALIVLIVENPEARDFLSSFPNFKYIKVLIVVGFLFYILAVIYALLSFKIVKYVKAPCIKSMDFIKEVYEDESNKKLSLRHFSNQILEATNETDKVNKTKHKYLLAATIFLLMAIVCTAIAGISIIVSIQ